MEMFEAGMIFYQLDLVLNIWLLAVLWRGDRRPYFLSLYGLSAHSDPCTVSNFTGWRDGHVLASLLAYQLHPGFCFHLVLCRFLPEDDDSNQPCGGNTIFPATAYPI